MTEPTARLSSRLLTIGVLVCVAGLFVFTGWIIQQAFNPRVEIIGKTANRVTFNQATVENIKSLGGQVKGASTAVDSPF